MSRWLHAFQDVEYSFGVGRWAVIESQSYGVLVLRPRQ